jgi:hypothetical protein
MIRNTDKTSYPKYAFNHTFPLGVSEDWLAHCMLPEGVHNRECDVSYLLLNANGQRADELFSPEAAQGNHEGSSQGDGFLYGVNVIRTKYDASVRRGAVLKSIAAFSPYHFIDTVQAVLDLALQRYLETADVFVIEDLFRNINSCDLSTMPLPNMNELSLMRRGVAFQPMGRKLEEHTPNAAAWTYKFTIDDPSSTAVPTTTTATSHDDATLNSTDLKTFSSTSASSSATDSDVSRPSLSLLSNTCSTDRPPSKISLYVPLYRSLDEFGDISVSTLVRTFREGTMQIFHGIFTKQRVLFVGYNHAAREVCQMVMSAVAMVAPPLSQVIRRAFPYANLTDLAFLEVCCDHNMLDIFLHLNV